MTDIELVKMDLLNHIYTRRGERVHMPRFGTRIPELLFEPLDGFVIDVIREDLIQVFEFDPRVNLLDLTVTPMFDQNAVVASAKLLYIELDTVDTMDLNIVFESQ